MSNDLYSTTPDDEIVEQCARCKKWLTNYEVHPKYECDECLLARAETAEADNVKLRDMLNKLVEIGEVMAEETYVDDAVAMFLSLVAEYQEGEK